MMHTLAFWLALFAAPFWEAKAPQDWSEDELQRILSDSPWAQTIPGQTGVQSFLASAKPIQVAEQELARRRKRKGDDTTDREFSDFLREDRGQHLVLAVACPNCALASPADDRKMEEECFLKVGKKKYKMTGHFPPTPSDPYLRLVFPRQVGAADKTLSFDLYLPGVPGPYRMVDYRVKDLLYRGVPEM